jgi:twitching motility protein PilT
MEINELLEICVKRNASDLHISPCFPPICRIDGDLVSLPDTAPLSPEATQELILKLMSKEQQEILKSKLQLDFSIIIENLGSFRVNAFRQALGLAAVFRVIPITVPTLEELGLPGVIKKLLNLSSGLILLTGPTGCGKSTSLAAMVNHININHSRHIITIEDPIEFTHHSKKCLISQRQVYRDATDFSEALRAALREDPDVILVGEMRDLETIRLALTAAETGHLVMGTLHTSTAPRAVNRIIDVFPAGEKNMIRNLVSESLQAVICQVLVNKVPSGRLAAFEIMLGTTAIRNLIREDKVAQMYSVIQTCSQKGMCTMEASIQALIDKNLVSAKAVLEHNTQRDIFDNPETLQEMI